MKKTRGQKSHATVPLKGQSHEMSVGFEKSTKKIGTTPTVPIYDFILHTQSCSIQQKMTQRLRLGIGISMLLIHIRLMWIRIKE